MRPALIYVIITEMSSELYFAPVVYVPKLSLRAPVTLAELCRLAGTACKASGAWSMRKVELKYGKKIDVLAEPGDWGNVRISIPHRTMGKRARFALTLLAYGMHDLVAKQSIIGCAWARPAPPRGRPSKKRALSSKERQRRFRRRHCKSF